MAIYCIKCGASLPDEAIFCLKCGKPVQSGSSSSTASPSSEAELYRCDIKELFKYTDRYGGYKELGKCVCVVTNRRLVFHMRNGGVNQVFLRDLEGVRAKDTPSLFFPTAYAVYLDGYGYVWCQNKG